MISTLSLASQQNLQLRSNMLIYSIDLPNLWILQSYCLLFSTIISKSSCKSALVKLMVVVSRGGNSKRY